MKEVRGGKRAVGKNAAKQIAYLRDQYLSWMKDKDVIPRFDSVQQALIPCSGIRKSSAHALLDEIVRRVLNRAWNKIIPFNPRELRTPEENHWPDAKLLADADLDEIAEAVLLRRSDDIGSLLDAACVNDLEETLKQEYARLLDPGQGDRGR